MMAAGSRLQQREPHPDKVIYKQIAAIATPDKLTHGYPDWLTA